MSEDRPCGNPPPQSSITSPEPATLTISSNDILKGAREIFIQHGAERYRLRVTKAGKLILNK